MSNWESLYFILLEHQIANPNAVAKLIADSGIEFESTLKLLKQGVPIEYILQKVDFYGVQLKITPDVLIPRSETEILVDKIVTIISKDQRSHIQLLDLCTGSGCIALSLKKKFPNIDVVAVDISPKAVDLALENSRLNSLDVNFLLGDMFDPLDGLKFDYVVSNPPYISYAEFQDLDCSVKQFEPEVALTDQGDGLKFYRKIADRVKNYLNPNAKIFLEIGCNQKEELFQIFSRDFFKNLNCAKDYAGHDRFFYLEYGV